MTSNHSPSNVFTPRAPAVNVKMWARRVMLEDELKAALEGALHIVIHGESGCGKTWLCGKVFDDIGCEVEVANFANASRLGGIGKELQNLVDRQGVRKRKALDSTKDFSAKVSGFGGGVVQKETYEFGEREPFEACLQYLSDRAGERMAVLVFDNLEAIMGSECLLKELAEILILCDDPRYSSYGVKIVIIGATHSLREYYREAPYSASLANRMREISRVSRLQREPTKRMLEVGFLELLKYEVEEIEGCDDVRSREKRRDLEDDVASEFDSESGVAPSISEDLPDAWTTIVEHVVWVTDCIPQEVHAYGLELGTLAEENGGRLLVEMLDDADANWIQSRLTDVCAVVEENMNDEGARIGRRNQLMWALSFVLAEEFSKGDVVRLLRRQFPSTMSKVRIDVGRILSELRKGDRPLICQYDKRDKYRFVNSRLKLALRLVLEKREDESVRMKPSFSF